MQIEKKYKAKSWWNIDDDIFYAAIDFWERKDLYPNMVVMNEWSWRQLCWVLSVAEFEEYINEDGDMCVRKKGMKLRNGKEPDVEDFGTLQYIDCSLKIATIAKDAPKKLLLKDREFVIIYDDKPDDDDDDVTTDLIPVEPVGKRCIFEGQY